MKKLKLIMMTLSMMCLVLFGCLKPDDNPKPSKEACKYGEIVSYELDTSIIVRNYCTNNKKKFKIVFQQWSDSYTTITPTKVTYYSHSGSW